MSPRLGPCGLMLAAVALLAACGIGSLGVQPAPKVAIVGYLGAQTSLPLFDTYRDALRELGYVEDQNVKIEGRFYEPGDQAREASPAAEAFEGAFQAISGGRPDGLLVLAEGVVNAQIPRVIEFAAQQRLPAMYETRDYSDAGGLMNYGINRPDLWRRAAIYTDKLLK